MVAKSAEELYVLVELAGRPYATGIAPSKIWTVAEKDKFVSILAPGIVTKWVRLHDRVQSEEQGKGSMASHVKFMQEL